MLGGAVHSHAVQSPPQRPTLLALAGRAGRARLEHPARERDLRRVAHVAAARVEAQHDLQPQPGAPHRVEQLPVAAPVIAPRVPLDGAPLRGAPRRMSRQHALAGPAQHRRAAGPQQKRVSGGRAVPRGCAPRARLTYQAAGGGAGSGGAGSERRTGGAARTQTSTATPCTPAPASCASAEANQHEDA